MEFTLYKYGQVNSQDTPDNKHKLRCEFHHQLKRLWELSSWNHEKNQNWQKNPWKLDFSIWKKDNKLFKEKFKKNFICLASEDLNMYVELKINFFVPQDTRFRDIDNKLKTICDALKLPDSDKKGNPPRCIKDWNQENIKNENPLVCLVEDDDIIYKIDADVDYLFNGENRFLNKKEMLCIINVKIKGNRQLNEYNDLII